MYVKPICVIHYLVTFRLSYLFYKMGKNNWSGNVLQFIKTIHWIYYVYTMVEIQKMELTVLVTLINYKHLSRSIIYIW